MKNMLKCHLSENNYQAFYTKWANVGCPQAQDCKDLSQVRVFWPTCDVRMHWRPKSVAGGAFFADLRRMNPDRVGARRSE